MLIRFAAALALFISAASAQNAPTPAVEAMQQGMLAFQGADYALASLLFAEACELESSLIEARLYYGYAEMMQFVPGGEAAENVAHGEAAIAAFLAVRDREPENKLAATALASLYFNMKRFDEAIRAHERVIELDPMAAESHYTIGVICWMRSYEPRLEARAALGMKPADPGPIADPVQRGRLALLIKPSIDAGLAHLRKAIEINPEYVDAMAYLNLLHRELADVTETEAEYQGTIRMADQWVQRLLDARKAQANQSPQ